MKRYLKYFIITLLLATGLSACQKGELENHASLNPVHLYFKGFVINDTLEFVLRDKVICTAFESSFKMTNGDIYTPGEMIIRKKKDHKQVGRYKIEASPYNVIKDIFYDGNTVVDKIILDPVSNPENMGFKLRFKTIFPGFYGGPVDIQIYDQQYDPNTFEYLGDNTPVRLIRNVTTSFGGFIEISLPNTDLIAHFITFKVFKTGTTQLPFTDDVIIPDPDAYFGILNYAKGQSQLLNISPVVYEDGKLGDGYSADPILSQ